jgi:rRNA maturation RNase YbeY
LFHDEQARSGLKTKRRIKSWIIKTIQGEYLLPGEINIVFLRDEELRKVNIEYLSRDYYTDIITFDYSEGKILSGDILISIDRVQENARKFKVSRNHEILRVIIHGILHLAGYKDSSEKEKIEMSLMEDKYLELYFSME